MQSMSRQVVWVSQLPRYVIVYGHGLYINMYLCTCRMFQTANALPVQSAKSATKTVAYVAARLALMAKNATNVRVGSMAFHLVNHANATQVDQEMVTSVMPKLVNVNASQGSQVITAPNVD